MSRYFIKEEKGDGVMYHKCTLCAHACGVDRTRGVVGRCKSTDKIKIARAALHPWEEPPITGKNGSGTIFFSGCSLGCIYCQNYRISRGDVGREITRDELVRTMLSLEEAGATNINFVTPTHFVPDLLYAIPEARRLGLSLPIVYNTSSYERLETLRALDGLVDIYLPDLKYTDPRLAERYSGARDYPEVAMRAIEEMMRQCPTPIFDDASISSPASMEDTPVRILKRGTVARILILPEATANAKLAISHLYRTYGDKILISIMGQYTPVASLPAPLSRPLSHAEYNEVVQYAQRIGVTSAFVQSLESAKESFIPPFDI